MQKEDGTYPGCTRAETTITGLLILKGRGLSSQNIPGTEGYLSY